MYKTKFRQIQTTMRFILKHAKWVKRSRRYNIAEARTEDFSQDHLNSPMSSKFANQELISKLNQVNIVQQKLKTDFVLTEM